ncbi:MAG: carboxymuconolactone decarboxylase family protein [Myxococcota bacterium]
MTVATHSHHELTDPPRSEHGVLPLAPIEKPKGLFLRLLYWITRRRYGITPTAFRVVYGRSPALAFASLGLLTVLDRFLTLDRELRFLLQVGTSMVAGCTFCADIALAEAVRARIGKERFEGLLDPEASPHLGEKERAVLAYAAAVEKDLHVEDAVFARLRRSFSEREVLEVVWIVAVERYFHSMALPLRIGSDHLAAEPLE